MSNNRWGASISLLHEQLQNHGKAVLDACDENNVHEAFAGKLYLIASAEIAQLEGEKKMLLETLLQLHNDAEAEGLHSPGCFMADDQLRLHSQMATRTGQPKGGI